MKYYNNQNIEQKSRSFIEAWMGIKSPSCRIIGAFSGDILTARSAYRGVCRDADGLKGYRVCRVRFYKSHDFR
jgi:hypothetical protein